VSLLYVTLNLIRPYRVPALSAHRYLVLGQVFKVLMFKVFSRHVVDVLFVLFNAANLLLIAKLC
jgi:hypothetical protein